ncbi:MAG: N-acetyltransferase [Bacteroidales bacterium]|nr:N-acetyltransferase [Bacteroidales bacterium]MDD4216880.1 N-acetyltransferase [Bacteroidales bacterium]MDY0143082.1 N-acetyltransferase [Bacteroidales bacterium]
MSNKFVLRNAILDDSIEISQLETNNFAMDAFSQRQIKYLITKAKSFFVVAENNNKIVASMVLLNRQNYSNLRLYSIVVDEKFRGHGVARQLMDYAITKAVKLNKKAISLEVRIDNFNAIVFYERYGFIKSSILKSYYEDETDAWRMNLFL